MEVTEGLALRCEDVCLTQKLLGSVRPVLKKGKPRHATGRDWEQGVGPGAVGPGSAAAPGSRALRGGDGVSFTSFPEVRRSSPVSSLLCTNGSTTTHVGSVRRSHPSRLSVVLSLSLRQSAYCAHRLRRVTFHELRTLCPANLVSRSVQTYKSSGS